MNRKNKVKKYIRTLTKNDFRTFEGWKTVGRHVIKGQKCVRDSYGRALFHINQTNALQEKVKFMTDGKGSWDDDDGRFEGFDGGHFL